MVVELMRAHKNAEAAIARRRLNEMTAILDTTPPGADTYTGLPSFNVKTARSWRGIVVLTHLAREGANDNHYRTAGLTGRTRRCRGRVAGRGASASEQESHLVSG